MRPSKAIARLAEVEVFAVEDRSAQIIWRGSQPATISVDGQQRSGSPVAGPVAVDIDDLAPGQAHEIVLRTHRREHRVEIRTLTSPPGGELGRIATISDLHFGARRFGLWFAPSDADGTPLEQRHPQRCARSAVSDLHRWGADLLVIKGDCTEHGRAVEWDSIGRFLDEIDIPVIITAGNHDTKGLRGSIGYAEGLARIGREPRPVQSADIHGARLIVADSTVTGRGFGTLEPIRDEILELAGTTSDPVILMFHQHLHHHRIPRMWPLGVFRPEARRFIADLSAANPAALVTTGHSHRNRRSDIAGVPITEVGSVKDHPGGWAGYVLHEGGIRQVIRRLADPAALAWTDEAALAVGGIWARWSPGTIAQRCFSHAWSTNRPAAAAPADMAGRLP